MEVLPFTLGRRENSAEGGADHAVDGGLDLRLGLGTSATVSATINPDFGQVELDPAVLNLTVFETFFPEKRPFFLEDSGTFLLPFQQFPLFHSRRIGQRPGRFSLKAGDRLVSKPDQTTILGAAKLTRKASGWTYGGLTALTAREYATVDATRVDGEGHEAITRVDRLIEPRTLYSVGRIQRDILGGSSTVGAIASAVVRERDADAFTGGIDYNIRWSRNRFGWNGHWVGTQAPVAGEMRADVGGASNFGFFDKHLAIFSHLDHFGPKFRNTDLGFLTSRVNKNEFNGGLSVGQPDPWGIFRNIQTFIGGGRQWTDDNLVFGRWAAANVFMQFRNFWTVNTGNTHNFRRLDDLDTRGGPPIVRPASDFLFFNLGTDSRKRWGLFLGLSGSRDEEGGWDRRIGPTLRLQPSARLQASLSSDYTHGRDVAQWITNSDVDADGTTDHIYGRLRRDVLSLTGRATYAFSRDLTLEVYLQPFVAVGDYTDVRRLARPRSFEFKATTLSSDPDFNRKSLRGNAVLRWEYIRGSTLFVVWNLSTSDAARPGVFTPLQDLRSAFGAEGTHVFMIKLNYWLGL